MKQLFIYLLFPFYCISLNAQTSTFIKKYNYYESVAINTIKNKNYIYYTPASGNSGFIAELTDNGDTLKAKCFNTSTKFYPPSLREGYWQNSILVVASTFPYSQNVTGTLFAKTDTNLHYSIFKKYTRATNNTFGVTPNELSDSSFIFTGLTSQNQNSIYPWDIAVMKTDKSGNTLWAKKYDMGFDDGNRGKMIVNNDKSLLIYGYTAQTSFTPDILLLKLDSLGNQLWAKAIGGNKSENATLFRIKNYYYLVGTSTSYSGAPYSSGICIYKLDTLGNLINAKYITGIIQPQADEIVYNNNGTFTLTGISDFPAQPYWDFIAMQIDTNGLVLNNKVYSLTTGEDLGYSFVRTSDGGYIFNCTGSTGPPTYPPDYPILFKTDSLFNSDCLPSQTYSFTTTDVTSQTHDTAIVFNVSNIAINVSADTILPATAVYAVNTECVKYVGVEEEKKQEKNINIYPNPANNIVNISYQLPDEAAQAIVNTYDYTGKLVSTQPIYGNKGLTSIGVENLPSGLYMYNITVNSTTIATQRIVISK